MGLKSAGFFCNTNLGLCFNRESFENFMKSQEDPVIQNTNYFKSFSRYLDDCSLLAPVRSKYNGYYILLELKTPEGALRPREFSILKGYYIHYITLVFDIKALYIIDVHF